MGVLASSMRAVDPFADSYYATSPPMWSLAGVDVGEEGWRRIATANECVTILKETVGSLSCKTYRRLPNSGKDEAPDHPLYDILHTRPNEEQTASEWFEEMTGWAAMNPWAYAEILPGRRGDVDQLIPLSPGSVKKVRVTGDFGSANRYDVTQPDGSTRKILADDIFRLRGLGDMASMARDTFGTALAAEQYQARGFKSAPRPAGVLQLPKEVNLSPEARDKLHKELKAHAGAGSNQALILDGGATYQSVGMTNEQAQYDAMRRFSVLEICRRFRIPPHMVGDLQAGASYASIEMMSLEFVIYTMLPWFRRWEQAISRDLILAPQTYFAEFVVAGLLRGDIASRYAAYAVGRQWGWLSVNDIRRFENMNPIPGGDTYLSPLNMAPASGPSRNADGTTALHPGSPTAYMLLGPDGKPVQLEEGTPAHALAALFAGDAAASIVHKERTAIGKLAHGNGAWETGVRAFYSDHGEHVAKKLHISEDAANAWAERQMNALLADGPAALDRVTTDDLASLALESA